MGWVDFILNVAALLIWLSWRSMRFDPLARTTPATLIGTLRPAGASRLKGWQLLTGLLLILVLRALLYWEISSGAEWTPRLNLGAVVLAFRTDSFPRGISLRATFFYSLLSFLRVAIIFYFWLVVLALVNRAAADTDPIQKLLRLHLGRIARWSWPVQLSVAILFVVGAWIAFHPLLVWLEVITRARSVAHLFGQGLLVAVWLGLSLKCLLPVFLLLHLVTSYVYLGSNAFWDFVSTTARNLLAPLRGLPLRYGKLDLAPLVGLLLIILTLFCLPASVQYVLGRYHLTLWPQ